MVHWYLDETCPQSLSKCEWHNVLQCVTSLLSTPPGALSMRLFFMGYRPLGSSRREQLNELLCDYSAL